VSRKLQPPALTDEEQKRDYAPLLGRPMAAVAPDVMEAIERGPIDPREALPFEEKNRLLEPGYLAKETGYCFMPDGSCYAAVLTRMPGVTGEMIDWWFAWHGLEGLRYRVWYPGAHFGASVSDRTRVMNESLPYRDRYLHVTHYVTEDIGIGPDLLSIKFLPPADFGFEVARFKKAGVATAICTRVGSVSKRAEHTDMCHFVRTVKGGVEMRSRFWTGRRMKVAVFPEGSPVNRAANTRAMRRIFIPRGTPRATALHCAREYANLAEILPGLYRKHGR
jgi:phloretin hydrolase